MPCAFVWNLRDPTEMCNFAPTPSNTFRGGPKVSHCLNLHWLFLQKRKQGMNRFLPGVSSSAEGNAVGCSVLQCAHQPELQQKGNHSKLLIKQKCPCRAGRAAGEDNTWNTHKYYQKTWSFLPPLCKQGALPHRCNMNNYDYLYSIIL